jgi:hypothetical protein
MSASQSDISAPSEPAPSIQSIPATRLSDCGIWQIGLPTRRRRVILFASVIGVGFCIGGAFQFPSNAALVFCCAGALAVVSGFAGLWSG